MLAKLLCMYILDTTILCSSSNLVTAIDSLAGHLGTGLAIFLFLIFLYSDPCQQLVIMAKGWRSLQERKAWDWALTTSLDHISAGNINQAYRITSKQCKSGSCRSALATNLFLVWHAIGKWGCCLCACMLVQ